MYICTYLSVIINLIYFYNHAVGAFLTWWMALFRRTVFQQPTRARERADARWMPSLHVQRPDVELASLIPARRSNKASIQQGPSAQSGS